MTRGHRIAVTIAAVCAVSCDAILGVTDVPEAGTTGHDAAFDARRVEGGHGGNSGSGTKDAAHEAAKDGSRPAKDSGKDASPPRESGTQDAREDVTVTGPDSGVEAGVEAGKDAGNGDTGVGADAGSGPVHLISPLSTSRVTSQHPLLSWTGNASSIDVCLDPLCGMGVSTNDYGQPVTGSSYTVQTTLSPTMAHKVFFWRLHYMDAGNNPKMTPTWEFTVPAVALGSVETNRSWGTMLDMDEDGYTEFAVGLAAEFGTISGFVNILSSKGGTVAPTSLNILSGGGVGGSFGWSVASAGDLNGDGYADLVVGAPHAQGGLVYVYLGGASLLSQTIPLSNPAPSTCPGFGTSVSSGGDINGDGYADLVIGAPGTSTTSGCVFVYYGSAAGPSPSMFTLITLAAASNAFGFSVASAGDVNGDGYGDVIIGAPGVYTGAAGTPNPTGYAYVYKGGPKGLASSGTTLTNNTVGDGFGSSVACAGDINGDGYADVIIGSPSTAEHLQGVANVYLGGPGGTSSTSAALVDAVDGTTAMFGYSVASAGDIDADGYADIVVGAPGETSNGAAYVYFGNATPSKGLTSFARITESAAGQGALGWSVGCAGNLVTGHAVSTAVGFLPESTASTGAVTFWSAVPGAATLVGSFKDTALGDSDSFAFSIFGATD